MSEKDWIHIEVEHNGKVEVHGLEDVFEGTTDEELEAVKLFIKEDMSKTVTGTGESSEDTGYLCSGYLSGSLHAPIRLKLAILESEHNANIYQDSEGKYYMLDEKL